MTRAVAAGPGLTDVLCTRCGLCCDGTLLADVELAGRAEATRMEVLGLRVDDDEDRALMLLPCAALRGTRCSVYAHRPGCCRSFECGLLQDVRRGTVSVGRAIGIVGATRGEIARVESLLARLGRRQATLPLRERVAEALAAESGGARAAKLCAELKSAMAAVERAIRESFLGSSSRGRGSASPGGSR